MGFCRRVGNILCVTAIIASGALPARAAVPTTNDYMPSAERVVVVANSREPESEKIARYYMQKRQIPEKNLILIDAPTAADITWTEFVEQVFNPLRQRLTKDGWLTAYVTDQKDHEGRLRYVFYGSKIDFLVVCYGVPVRIQNDPTRLVETPLVLEHRELNTTQAAVDSELALLAAPDTPTTGLVANPLFQISKPDNFTRAEVVKVARLDGPDPAAVRGLVDSALAGEANGLQGRAYIDMGGPHQEGDDWLKADSETLRKLGFDLSVDHNRELFGWSDRFDAPAIYFGWYSDHLAGPISDPKFHFPPGAIAVHIHSFSASMIRNANQQWVGPLVERGVAATLGNVYEPYLSFTHHLDLFMDALAAGKTTGEAAYYSLPALSWQEVFIGDPLYRPFALGLPEQLDRAAHSPNAYSTYAIIRQMNLLQAEGRTTDALAFGQTQFDHQPDLALALALAQLGHDSDALKRLAWAATTDSASRENLGLFAEAARWAAANGGRPLALDLYAKALAAEANSEFLKTILPDAITLATQTGNAELRVRWQNQLDGLIPHPDHAATP